MIKNGNRTIEAEGLFTTATIIIDLIRTIKIVGEVTIRTKISIINMEVRAMNADKIGLKDEIRCSISPKVWMTLSSESENTVNWTKIYNKGIRILISHPKMLIF